MRGRVSPIKSLQEQYARQGPPAEQKHAYVSPTNQDPVRTMCASKYASRAQKQEEGVTEEDERKRSGGCTVFCTGRMWAQAVEPSKRQAAQTMPE